MSNIYMTCGKVCSGKSTYAKMLRDTHRAVILSIDEIMLALFGQDAGEQHDQYVASIKAYLLDKSLEILQTGINVVLDWGFWTAQERQSARQFYESRAIKCEFHYIDIENAEWHRRIEARNREVLSGNSDAYYIDDGLATKFEAIFEPPSKSEIDVWVEQ